MNVDARGQVLLFVFCLTKTPPWLEPPFCCKTIGVIFSLFGFSPHLSWFIKGDHAFRSLRMPQADVGQFMCNHSSNDIIRFIEQQGRKVQAVRPRAEVIRQFDSPSPQVPGCNRSRPVNAYSERAATPEEVDALPYECPSDLREFWREAQTARLFEDREYGQWGIELFEPKQAIEVTNHFRTEYERDFVEGDLVVGRFLGDSEMLMIRCDPAAVAFGSVVVTLPLDPRIDWYYVAESFAEFLKRYAKSGGDKFWEEHGD